MLSRMTKIIGSWCVLFFGVLLTVNLLADSGTWANTRFQFDLSPPAATWSSSTIITVSWTNINHSFSQPSGYRYRLDSDYATSYSNASDRFTLNQSADCIIYKNGIYYFHLWMMDSSGKMEKPVYTVGPFFISKHAGNLPAWNKLPDIKLLCDDTAQKVFSLPDYLSNSVVPLNWSVESSWRFHHELGIALQRNGNEVYYTPDTGHHQPGRQRIKYTADDLFNQRSVVKLSTHLWGVPFPPFITKNGRLQDPLNFRLEDYLKSAKYTKSPQFDLKHNLTGYLESTVMNGALKLSISSTLPYPAWVRLRVRGNPLADDEDTQLLWIYENFLENGDFQSEVTTHWSYQLGPSLLGPGPLGHGPLGHGPLGHGPLTTPGKAQWQYVAEELHQPGVLRLTQWGASSVKIVQNKSANPVMANPYIPIHSGTWYTLRAKLKTDNPMIIRNLSMQIHGYGAYSGSTSLMSAEMKTLSLTTEWQSFELSYYSRTNLAAVVFVSQTLNADTSSIYLDDVELIEQTPDSVKALGNTSINLVNSDFQENLSGWGFEGGNGTPLQSQDTGWIPNFEGRTGICVLNSSTSTHTKMTQYYLNTGTEKSNFRFRVWAATDTYQRDSAPQLMVLFNTYDRTTQTMLNTIGYASFHVNPGRKWAHYDFACSLEDPVLAVQLQGRDLRSAKLYIDKIQLDQYRDQPDYWDREAIGYTEMVESDTVNTNFFRLNESKERYVPYGGNLHIYYHPFGLTDDWWNPYAEDSNSMLWFDNQCELLKDSGGNVIKLIVLIHDLLPDKDREFSGATTVGTLFPSIQSYDAVKIPPRYLDRLDQMISSARRHGLRVMLTLPFNYQQMNWWLEGGGNYGDTTKRILSLMWQQITARYKDDPVIFGYSLNVEHWMQMREWGDVNYAYRLGKQDLYFYPPVSKQWHAWLRKKYNNNVQSLNTAWSQVPLAYRNYCLDLPYTSFDSIAIPGYDGKNTIGSSAFTGSDPVRGIGGGGNTTRHIPNSPVRLDSGINNHLVWQHPADTTYLTCYYVWRQEKGITDTTAFGTTWHLLSVLWDKPTTFFDESDGYFASLSSYRYEVTSGNQDAWGNYAEGTPENENASYDPALYDFMKFRESVVDEYNYAQTSTMYYADTGGVATKPHHLTSIGLAQFNYFLRWSRPVKQWGDGASYTPEAPHSSISYNPKELVKSMDYQELSYYTGFPQSPLSADNPNPGYALFDKDGRFNEESLRASLQYLQTLLRFYHEHASPGLSKPILLKEFAGSGENPQLQTAWNHILLDYTKGETAGWLIWYITDDTNGIFNHGYSPTAWGDDFRRRADDIKSAEDSFPASSRVILPTTGMSTASNWMFLMTSSQYRNESVSTTYDPASSYFTLGRFMKQVKSGDILPRERLTITAPDNETILRKPEF